jgi:hypothetical protein
MVGLHCPGKAPQVSVEKSHLLIDSGQQLLEGGSAALFPTLGVHSEAIVAKDRTAGQGRISEP